MSADRLFRVRSKQPYSSNFRPDTLQIKSSIDETSELPQKLEVVQIEDVCVVLIQHEWRIGKVLQFITHLVKHKSPSNVNKYLLI